MLIKEKQKSQELGEKSKKDSVSEKHLKDVEHICDEIKKILPVVGMVIKDTKNSKVIGYGSIPEVDRLVSQLIAIKNEINTINREQAISKLENLSYLKDQSIKELERIWSEYRSEKYSKNANMIHSLLNVIDNDARLDELGKIGNAITVKRIGDAETVSNIQRYQKLSKEIIKDLNMSPDIESFIMRLTQGEELALSDVTNEIMG